MTKNEILFECAFRGWKANHISTVGVWQAGIQDTYAVKHLIEAGLKLLYVKTMIKKLHLEDDRFPIVWAEFAPIKRRKYDNS